MQQKVHCLCEAMHLHQRSLLNRCSVGTAGLPKRFKTYIEKIRHPNHITKSLGSHQQSSYTNRVRPKEHSILTTHEARNYDNTPVQGENSQSLALVLFDS